MGIDLKQQVIEARFSGLSYGQIAEHFGVPKSTARDWVNAQLDKTFSDLTVDFTYDGSTTKSCEGESSYENNAIGYVNNNLQRIKPTKKDLQIPIDEFLENLAPIQFNGLQIPRVNSHLSNYAVVCSDLHFPLECKKSVAILFETIRQLQPSTIIINGDSCDMLAVSKYPKDIQTSYSLLEERIAYQEFLATLVEISNGATLYETSANHSSGGIQGRWRRYLSERIGELGCLPEVFEALSYENIFMGQFKDIVKSVDYVDLNGLIVLHGDIVRANAGASALGMIQKLKSSVMVGHVHRLASTSVRQPAIANRKEGQHLGYEIGCMCDLNPIYASSPNWQNGFAIVCLDDDSFGVELVTIIDGKTTISTLGQTLTA